jgi:hypothetical protein
MRRGVGNDEQDEQQDEEERAKRWGWKKAERE